MLQARNRVQEAIPGLGTRFGKVFPDRNSDQEVIPGLGVEPLNSNINSNTNIK